MVDHGFVRTDFSSSLEKIKAVANDISKEPKVVAVHYCELVDDEGHYGIIALSDEAIHLGKEVIPKICKKNSVEIRSTKIWRTKASFRHGKVTIEAFV